MVRWGLSSSADHSGPPSRSLGAGEAATQWMHPLVPAGPLSPPGWDVASVSNPAENLTWCSAARGSGLSVGGRLPDSHKPGTDGVGWSGKGPGEASWTAAQRGDCLSAQALGHAATPPWARAPALGFQRDVTGCGGLAFLLHRRIPSPLRSSPKPPIFPPNPPNAPPTAFLLNPLTLCHSHHCFLTFRRRRGEVVLLHCTHLPHVFPCCGP